MTSWEPHPETCACDLCALVSAQPTDYRDVWSGNPDTDKQWAKEH